MPAKVRLECGKMRGTLKILLTSSHFTALSAHGLAGLGWAGWAGLAGWAGWAGWARWAGWLAGRLAGQQMHLECGIRRVTISNPMEMRILRTFTKKDAKSRQEAPGTPAKKINFYRKL